MRIQSYNYVLFITVVLFRECIGCLRPARDGMSLARRFSAGKMGMAHV